MQAPEIVISAALVVLAIVMAAALVAVCIVIAGSFVAVTTSLSGGAAPRFAPVRRVLPRSAPSPPPREEPEPRREPERYSDRLTHDIVTNAAEGIVVYDRDMRCIVWNRFMEDLTGIPANKVLGKRATELFPQSEYGMDDILGRALKGETVEVPETHCALAGSDRTAWIAASFRPQRSENGHISAVVGHIRDQTEHKRAEQQIEYQAYHDALTGLPNRRLFQEHLTLAIALAQRRNGLLAVFFLDLDHFKVINESLGHTVGDALLRVAAMRLKAHIREGDVIARVGGDEFAVVGELKKKEDITVIVQKVLRTVGEPIEVDGHRLYVTTSIGIAVFPDDGHDAETLLKNADNAMFRAKAAGRNTYEMATEEMSRTMQERLTLESGLRQAIERSEFEVYYQPQIDVHSMKIVGMEALLRWRHPERGIVGPGAFISVAEERGFIVPIGEWVLNTACAQASRFRDAGYPTFRVAVNLSPRQFRGKELVSHVQTALERSGLDPRCLELEITESVAMENVDLTLKQLATLRETGITIAIDDFGMGHSSLSYLKKFPIDALKIDRNFVEELPERAEDAAIVRSVIELAQGLNLRVVAEGVENKQQLDFLKQQNCREVQGFYFGFPVPPGDFEKLLSVAGPSH